MLKNFNICLVLLIALPLWGRAQITPGGVNFSDVRFWIKANDGTGATSTGNSVATWVDHSSLGMDVSQGTNSRRPSFDENNVNYNPSVLFDGTNDRMRRILGGSSFTSEFTIFTMTRLLSLTPQGSIFHSHRTGAGNGDLTSFQIDANGVTYRYRNSFNLAGVDGMEIAPYNDDFRLFTIRNENLSPNTFVEAYEDGAFSNSASFAGLNRGQEFQDYMLGTNRVESNFSNNYTAEIILVSDLLSVTDRRKVETYLAIKYASTLDNAAGGAAGDYLSPSNLVVWDATLTPNYHHDIIGLSREDTEGLLQKQSHTRDDTTRIYLDLLQTSNVLNAGSIGNDQGYVLIGHDLGKMCSDPATALEFPAGIPECPPFWRLDREWKVTKTNFTENISIDLALAPCTTPAPLTSANLMLLVDDDGDFSTGTTQYYFNGDGTGINISLVGSMITITHLSTTHVSNNATAYFTLIANGPPPTLDIVAFQHIDCNGSATGQATALGSGGIGTLTYNWATIPPQSTPTATGLPAGTWTVEVMDSVGCVKDTFVTLTEPTLLTAAITFSADATCMGASNGLATVTAGGGIAPYTYLWPSGAAITSAANSGLAAGTYVVTVTDDNLCTATASVTIADPTLMSSTILTVTNTSCMGVSDGEATLSTSGGLMPYSYAWSSGSTPTSAANSGLAAGTHSITITDANGCSIVESVTISEPSALVLSTTSLPASCATPVGSAMVTATGATPGYTYAWGTVPIQTTATATSLMTGTYTVTVTDAQGCTETAVILVDSLGGPTVSLVSQTEASCHGLADGTAVVTATGDNSPISFAWNTVPTQTGAMASGLMVGTYTVVATDGLGCEESIEITITEPTPLILTSSAQAVTCFNGMDGEALISVSGGTPGYTYAWATVPVQTNALATGLSVGDHAVTVTDVNGCTATESIPIGNQPAVIANFVSDPSLPNRLQGEDATITFTDSSINATQWLWDFGDGGSSTEANPIYAYTAEGTYCVTLIALNDNDCADTLQRCSFEIFEEIFVIPNAFTPNGDGLNDLFGPVGSSVDNYQFLIFDRWGKLVFQTHDITTWWDGKLLGKDLPEGSYVWRIDARRVLDDLSFRLSGSVVLLR